MKRFITITVLATVLVGCSTLNIVATPKQVVTSYETAGPYLTSFLTTLKPLCEAQTIKTDTCEALKVTYNKARAAYISAGDAEKVQIRATTQTDLAAAQASFARAMADLRSFIAELQKYIK